MTELEEKAFKLKAKMQLLGLQEIEIDGLKHIVDNDDNLIIVFDTLSRVVDIVIPDYAEGIRYIGNCEKLVIHGGKNLKTCKNMIHSRNGPYIVDFDDVDTSKVTTMEMMFYSQNIVETNLKYLDTSNVRNIAWMFARCPRLVSVDFSDCDLSKVESMSHTFTESTNLVKVRYGSNDLKNNKTLFATYSKCTSLIDPGVTNFDTSNTQVMSELFEDCARLESLDLRKWKTQNVVKFDRMFYGCRTLKKLNLSHFTSDKIAAPGVQMEAMFRWDNNLRIKCFDNYIQEEYKYNR